MAKKHTKRPRARVREMSPLFHSEGGNVQILCPFCNPPHPIFPDKLTPCGTLLRVTALQTVYPARTTRTEGILCVRCGKGGGDMVAYGKGYIHTSNCNPERAMLSSPPVYSEWARRVYNMPIWIRPLIFKLTGPAIEVNEVNERGVATGKVLGYYFGVSNGRTNSQRKHSTSGTK